MYKKKKKNKKVKIKNKTKTRSLENELVKIQSRFKAKTNVREFF